VTGFLMVPRLLVGDFLKKVRSNHLEQAYRLTSKAFQGYITQADFPTYVRSAREFTNTEATFAAGALRTGYDCRGNKRAVLEVGVRWNGEQLSRLIFVWEDYGWKFDCVSIP